MSEIQNAPPRRGKISLKLVLPATAFCVCAIMTGVVALLMAWTLISERESEAMTAATRIAELAAQDVATGRPAHVAFSGDQVLGPTFALLDNQDRVLAGDPALSQNPTAVAVPMIWSGETVGRVAYAPEPWFAVDGVFLTVISFLTGVTLIATLIARLFGVWIAEESRSLTAFADHIGRGGAAPKREEFPAHTPGFSDFSRMRIAVARAARRLSAEIDKLESAAYIDPTTKLPNRARLLQILSEDLPRAAYDRQAVFIHIDLAGYIAATDAYGGQFARAVLAAAAERLEDLLDACPHGGPKPSLSALGSDEFAIFMPPGSNREEASVIVRAIRLAFERPFRVEGRNLTLGVYGGISIAPEDGDTASELMTHAEMALDQAQSAGRGGFQFFSSRLDRMTQSRLKLEAELQSAVDNSEFAPVFQPKICFSSGEIIGAEALARWERPEGRTVSPGVFIPIAEEIGLIDAIGGQILRKSCEAAADWARRGRDLSVAVNVSPKQFEREDFIDEVLDAMRAAGLPPKRLELEITETMAVSNPQRVIEVMRPLRAMGVKLALDDFGTGHANLSILTQLSFDTFKIDRQFISALDAGGEGPAIVETILAMAETLGLKTVAEGVETQAQAEFLRRRGCTMAQGFLYAGGLKPAAFDDLLESWQDQANAPRVRRVG